MPFAVTISVFRPLRSAFTYEVSEGFQLNCGQPVEVPFGRGSCRGVVIDEASEREVDFVLKPLNRVFPNDYSLTPQLLRLAKWMSEYYLVPLGEILQAMCPPAMLQKENPERELSCSEPCGQAPQLSDGQKNALEKILSTEPGKPVLLHGVTGSGKTEVYLDLITRCISEGKSCLYLLPEITLTREMMRRLEKRFSSILVFHSGMTAKQRRENWLKAKYGGPYLIVGARSALFSPVAKLGLIIVDEEHDSSYKQDSTPRYHGRDLAVMLAHLEKARIILGSATPSLESYYHACSGKYALVEMSKRISPHPLPKVHVVDLKEERNDLKRKGVIYFSRLAMAKTQDAVKEKRQVIFFLNRRGFSTHVTCADCGETLSCKHCSVSLTYYKKRKLALCHHCGHEQREVTRCLNCRSSRLKFRGTGTEKMEELVEQNFAGMDIVRVDGTMDDNKGVQQKLAGFMKGEGDILLGTQMISKGLDSPNITLSVAINADLGLHIPDFRAAERDFQLLTQLAGRTGRGELEGECIFQTTSPDHYAICHAIEQNYKAFYAEECGYREQFCYPPYCRLARFIFSAATEKKLSQALMPLARELRLWAKQSHVALLGPAPAPLERIKGKTRWHLIAKSSSAGTMSHFLRRAMLRFEELRGISTVLDRDPQNMM